MKLTKYITPFVLLSLFTLLRIAYLLISKGGPQGWGYLGVLFLSVALFVMIIVDAILQVALSNKKYIVWIVEIAFIIIAWIFFATGKK